MNKVILISSKIIVSLLIVLLMCILILVLAYGAMQLELNTLNTIALFISIPCIIYAGHLVFDTASDIVDKIISKFKSH